MVNQLLINLLLFFATGLSLLIIGALVLNELPMQAPPGLLVRLRTYLSQNIAETRREHPFPELELPVYRMAPAQLFSRVERAMEILGWELQDSEPQSHTLHAVVESRLWHFKDDVVVKLVPGEWGTEIHVRAQSRVGKGDLGANTRHILNLLQCLGRTI